MNSNLVAQENAPDLYRLIYRAACLIVLIGCGSVMLAQTASGAASAAAASEIKGTQILGFEGTPNNSGGKLSIEGDALQFKKSDAAAVQVSIASIQDVALGEENKQIGGVPMMLGKAATPYGGGRVISLFSHKKYDTLTVQYLDTNGGLHGAIFRVAKGSGEDFKAQLVAKGAHVVPVTPKQTPEAASEGK